MGCTEAPIAEAPSFHSVTENSMSCRGSDVCSFLTLEWRAAGVLRSVLFNNSMHFLSDELPQPPWEKSGLGTSLGDSGVDGFSDASWYSRSNHLSDPHDLIIVRKSA